MLRANFSFQLQRKQLKIVVELFVSSVLYALPFTQKPCKNSIISPLFACTSHCAKYRKTFSIVYEDSIFKYYLLTLLRESLLWCATFRCIYSNIKGIPIYQAYFLITLDFIKSPNSRYYVI